MLTRLAELLREAWEDIVEGVKQDVSDVWENLRDLFAKDEP